MNYRGYEIKIEHDEFPFNPFEEWDCNPCVITSTGGIYNDGNDYAESMPDFTWAEMRPHIKRIKELFEVTTLSATIQSWGIVDPAETVSHLSGTLTDQDYHYFSNH